MRQIIFLINANAGYLRKKSLSNIADRIKNVNPHQRRLPKDEFDCTANVRVANAFRRPIAAIHHISFGYLQLQLQPYLVVHLFIFHALHCCEINNNLSSIKILIISHQSFMCAQIGDAVLCALTVAYSRSPKLRHYQYSLCSAINAGCVRLTDARTKNFNICAYSL